MEEVLKPWSVINEDYSLKKIAKENLSTHLEKYGAFVSETSVDYYVAVIPYSFNIESF